MPNFKLTKKQKQYLRDCCRDEIDVAREKKRIFKKKGLKTGPFDTWMRKHRNLLKDLK